MTKLQKRACRVLFDLSYEHGFHLFPRDMVAAKLGISGPELYDNETNTGLLWDLGPHGKGFISASDDDVGVCFDLKDMLETYCQDHQWHYEAEA